MNDRESALALVGVLSAGAVENVTPISSNREAVTYTLRFSPNTALAKTIAGIAARPKVISTPKTVSMSAAQEYTGISYARLKKLIALKQVRASKVKGRWMINWHDLVHVSDNARESVGGGRGRARSKSQRPRRESAPVSAFASPKDVTDGGAARSEARTRAAGRAERGA